MSPPAEDPPVARFGVLGPLVVSVDGREHRVPPGNQHRLLAVLLLARGRVVGADTLVEDVWGDEPPDSPTGSLHTTVARLRRSLGAAGTLVRTEGHGYRLAASLRDRDDGVVGDLLAAAGRCRGEERLALLDDALAQWRGHAWQEYADDLAVAEARRLADLRLGARESRAETLMRLGRRDEGIAELTSIITDRPLGERPLVLLVDALDRAGETDRALAELQRYRERLADELGLDPSDQVDRLHQRVLRREQSSSAVAPLPPAPVDAAAAGAPPADAAPTPTGRHAGGRVSRPAAAGLVGRDDLLDLVSARLAPGSVLTLVGPGGVGKTTLARAVAGRTDAWWADLLRASRPEDVERVVIAATGGHEDIGTSASDALRRRLATTGGVLVLDNGEHVLEAVADLVAALLEHSPDLTVLATSRRRLNLPGEIIVPVPPLRVEGDDDPEPPPAVSLFLDRAAADAPGLQVDDRTRRTVAALCRRLDGLPLAIELAAAQAGSVSLEDLEADLASHLDLLEATGRVGHERHRTLRATIRWSYDPLGDVERTVFRGLAVFAADVELAAAQRVVSCLGIAPGRVAVAVAELVRRSLVVAPYPVGTGRHRLLETLRVFAREESTPEEWLALTDAHRAWVLRVAEEAQDPLNGPQEPVWAARLTRLMPDLRVAFARALESGETAQARRIVEALARWGYLSLNQEVLDWADQVPVSPSEPPSPMLLVAGAYGAWLRGDHTRSTALAQQVLAGGHESRATALAHESLGDNALFTGDLGAAAEHYSTAAESALRAGRLAEASMAIAGHALVAAYAPPGGPGAGSARQDADEALALAHRAANPSALALAWYADGEVRGDADLPTALDSLARARSIDTGTGSGLAASVAQTASAALLGRAGPLTPETFAAVAEAIQHGRDRGSSVFLTTCLRNAVTLLVRAGEDRVALLVGDALARTPTQRASYGTEADNLRRSLTRAGRRTGGTDPETLGWVDLADAADAALAVLRSRAEAGPGA